MTNEKKEVVSAETFSNVIQMLLDNSEQKMLCECFNGDTQCQSKK
jgi:hypothetical protein